MPSHRRDNSTHFAQVPKVEIQRSKFDRSHGLKTTFDAGFLYPIFLDEALPGDTFTLKMHGFARLATPLKPIMDNLYLDTFFFAVPNRLLWSNWQKFNGEQDNPTDSTDFVIPTLLGGGGFATGDLGDYFGLPIGVATATGEISALPFRAYNRVWAEWFRDENLQDRPTLNTGDGPDSFSDYPLRARGKRHDYFTSGLPWPQKGDAVRVPIGDEAPIFTRGNVGDSVASLNEGTGVLQQYGTGGAQLTIDAGLGGGATMWADLQAATSVDINSLRQAFQVQRLLERDARGGTRYTEVIRSHFGVISPDARLQRPEYLGGGSSYVTVSPVAQTSGTADEQGQYTPTPQGNLAAMGTSAWSGHGFSKSFTEHCTIIGLMSVRADLTYQQGIERMWSRKTRFDFYWPALAHIGEQAVLNKEIYFDGTAADDDVFSYQERYAEYRYKPSRVTGKFRSADPQSLDIWHLAQEFATRPTLSDTFIRDNPPIDRIIAVQDEPHFLLDAWFNLKCARPMPVYGVPGMIDHF